MLRIFLRVKRVGADAVYIRVGVGELLNNPLCTGGSCCWHIHPPAGSQEEKMSLLFSPLAGRIMQDSASDGADLHRGHACGRVQRVCQLQVIM